MRAKVGNFKNDLGHTECQFRVYRKYGTIEFYFDSNFDILSLIVVSFLFVYYLLRALDHNASVQQQRELFYSKKKKKKKKKSTFSDHHVVIDQKFSSELMSEQDNTESEQIFSYNPCRTFTLGMIGFADQTFRCLLSRTQLAGVEIGKVPSQPELSAQQEACDYMPYELVAHEANILRREKNQPVSCDLVFLGNNCLYFVEAKARSKGLQTQCSVRMLKLGGHFFRANVSVEFLWFCPSSKEFRLSSGNKFVFTCSDLTGEACYGDL